MTPRAALASVVLLACGLTVVPSSVRPSIAAGCRHLLVDPAGDVQETGANPPAPIEDTRRVDIRTVDLRSNGKTLTAVMGLEALDPETPSLESHYYGTSFDLGGKRFYFEAYIDGQDQRFFVAEMPRPATAPEDANPPGVNHAEIIATVQGALDPRRRTLSVWAPLEVFALGPRSRATLSRVRATTAAGVTEPFGGAYFPADSGRTNGGYVTGAKSCA